MVQGMQQDEKPIAVICHGAWLLVSAGLAKGRTLTSWPTLQDDIRNAGGHWVDQVLVVDDNLISSRKPADIPVFTQKMLEILSRRLTKSLYNAPDQPGEVGLSS
jgi:protease I